MGFFSADALLPTYGSEVVSVLGLNLIFAICYNPNIFGGEKTSETCNCSITRSLSRRVR